MSRSLKYLFLACLSAALFSGCKTKRVITKSPLVSLGGNAILDQVKQNEFEFRSLNAKLSVDADTPEQNGSLKVNLRARKDSCIWMSITPALGIEAARVMIWPDTLQFIDKLKKTYFAGDYSLLDSLFQYETRFPFIENLLVGNPVEISPDEKYTATVEGLYYVLQTKVKRKLKKALQITNKPVDSDSSYVDLDVAKEKKFEKAIDKYGEEDLIVKRYYVRASDFRIGMTIIDDLLYQRTVIIAYDNFEAIEGYWLPMNIDVTITSPGEKASFDIEYSRIRLNEAQGYPFKIPSKYDPIE